MNKSFLLLVAGVATSAGVCIFWSDGKIHSPIQPLNEITQKYQENSMISQSHEDDNNSQTALHLPAARQQNGRIPSERDISNMESAGKPNTANAPASSMNADTATQSDTTEQVQSNNQHNSPALPGTLPAKVKEPTQEEVLRNASKNTVEQASPILTEERELQAKKEKKITAFRISTKNKGTAVSISTTIPASFKEMRLSNPERIVLDLEGKWQVKAPGIPPNDIVSNIRIAKEAKKTRIVIDLKKKPNKVNSSKTSNAIIVDIR